MILDSTFGLFIGRFHPLLVHLPIGFIILAILLELFTKKFQSLEKGTTLIWFLGALSAFMASVCGWLLAQEGGYTADTLFWHRWAGISLTVLTFVIWMIKQGWFLVKAPIIQGLSILTLLFMMFVGHLGGNLTHGSNYLIQYAPGFIQNLFGAQSPGNEDQKLIDIEPDSVLVYQNLIQPIFEKKCLSCHNEDKMKGGLLMDNAENILKGGDHGAVIQAGKSFDSEIIKRVTLPENDPGYMPPKGEGLTYQEIKLLEWWINLETPLEQKLSTYEQIPLDMQALLLNEYGLDTREKSYLETTQVTQLSKNQINNLQKHGFDVNLISQKNGFLEVSGKENLDKKAMKSLLEAKEQITWLNLGKTNLEDDMLSILSKLPNLTRLRLENNPITDQGITYLQNLNHLESLNLYKTDITDQSLEHLKQFKSLKKLYLWQNQISQAAIDKLGDELPHVEIDTGFRFAQKAVGL